MVTELEQHLSDLERVLGDKYIEIKVGFLTEPILWDDVLSRMALPS